MNTYLITDCFGIDRRVVARGFRIVESPDTTSDATTIVNKPLMTYNPHCINVTFEWNDLIRISFWWLMWEVDHCWGLGTARREFGL